MRNDTNCKVNAIFVAEIMPNLYFRMMSPPMNIPKLTTGTTARAEKRAREKRKVTLFLSDKRKSSM